MVRYRYSRWDGSQQSLAFEGDAVLGKLLPHVLESGSVAEALRKLLRRGTTNDKGEPVPGVDKLVERLHMLRDETLQQNGMSHIVKDLDTTLRKIVEREARALHKRLEEINARALRQEDGNLSSEERERLLRHTGEQAKQAQQMLGNLPAAVSQAVQKLRSHEFADGGARDQFEQMLGSMRAGVLDSFLGNLPGELAALQGEQGDELVRMLHDLNGLLEGSGSFEEFITKHAAFFPQRPATLDAMLASLKERQAGIEALKRGASSEMRHKLDEALKAALANPGLRLEMGRLLANLKGRDYEPPPVDVDGEIGLDEALEQVGRLQDIEDVERQLQEAVQACSFADVDDERLRRLLGEDAAYGTEALRHLASGLEDAGYVARSQDTCQLTAKGIRTLGDCALREVFAAGSGVRFGAHPMARNGSAGEPSEETKPFDFDGDLDIHIQRSLTNALRHGKGFPLRLGMDDIEVRAHEQTVRAATILAIDLSFSMAMRGNFPYAKKVALALEALIHTRYPQDVFHVVGFSTRARHIRSSDLPSLHWDDKDSFTNVQGALVLARRLLVQQTTEMRQVILITDGEPTAYARNGEIICHFPATADALAATLREVERCTGEGIVINTFMLEGSIKQAKFVDQMAKVNRGRVFFTDAEKLGRYLLVDYLGNRRLYLS